MRAFIKNELKKNYFKIRKILNMDGPEQYCKKVLNPEADKLTKKLVDLNPDVLKKWEKLKAKYKGKRCFIIGNGPSLKIEDLNKLKNEVTFASNRIYMLFKDTSWRPTYYAAQDRGFLEKSINKDPRCFYEIEAENIILPTYLEKYGHIIEFNENIFYIKPHLIYSFRKRPKFSNDITKVVHDGGTITYTLMQIAAYMGFKEIYLLGVDFSYNKTFMPDGSSKILNNNVDHFYNDGSRERTTAVANVFQQQNAYKSASLYSRFHYSKFYNATRGGNLENFKRVDFDSLF